MNPLDLMALTAMPVSWGYRHPALPPFTHAPFYEGYPVPVVLADDAGYIYHYTYDA